MSPEAVLNELKDKRLPTYGTGQEKRDRLKKQYGIVPKNRSAVGTGGSEGNPSMEKHISQQSQARRPTTTDKIDQIKLNRETRRLRMEEARRLKSERELNNELAGIKVDVEYQAMVEAEIAKVPALKPHRFAD